VIWVFNDFGCLFIQLDGSRYDNGDQREGFFLDNILDGQVIFTRRDGVTLIEQWVDGKQVQQDLQDGEDVQLRPGETDSEETGDTFPARNEVDVEESQSKTSSKKTKFVSLNARGGGSKSRRWGAQSGDQTGQTKTAESARLGQLARSRARSFLFDIFSLVNTG